MRALCAYFPNNWACAYKSVSLKITKIRNFTLGYDALIWAFQNKIIQSVI